MSAIKKIQLKMCNTRYQKIQKRKRYLNALKILIVLDERAEVLNKELDFWFNVWGGEK